MNPVNILKKVYALKIIYDRFKKEKMTEKNKSKLGVLDTRNGFRSEHIYLWSNSL